MKQVLFLAYFFPPDGGGGVQRVAKFVKYLPQFGYSSVAVAGSFGQQGVGRASDDSLASDVASARVHRVTLSPWEERLRGLESKMWFKYISGLGMRSWVSSATREAERAIGESRPDVICVSASPFASVRVAEKLSRKHGIPWVLDLRDPWALDPIHYYLSYFHYRANWRAMRRACQEATAVVMNTPRSLDALHGEFPDLPQEKLFSITNGFDSEDFSYTPPDADNAGPLRIVHTGTFLTNLAMRVDPECIRELGLPKRTLRNRMHYSIAHPNLLARTPYYLYRAIRTLLDSGQLAVDDLRITLAGDVTPADKQLAERFGVEPLIEYRDYVAHEESIRLLQESDTLFLPLHVPSGRGDPLIVPGKTYEYLAAQRPILAAMPPGDARSFVRDSGFGFFCEPTDSEQIGEQLTQLLRMKRSGTLPTDSSPSGFLQQFERKTLTGQLASVLDFATSSAPKP